MVQGFDLIADGLAFPEGPVVMADGWRAFRVNWLIQSLRQNEKARAVRRGLPSTISP